MFAAFAAVAFVASYIGPMGSAITRADANQANVSSLYSDTIADAQAFAATAEAEAASLDRQAVDYEVYVKPKPTPTPTPAAASSAGSAASSSSASAPAVAVPDPGTAQGIAYDMVAARGWGDDQFACLVSLWNKESGWRVNAMNPSSGAYGIPQSLPGSKMASAGADWQTNPATQITWGLGYISGRYGTPCGAWGHSQSVGWY